MLVSKIVDSVVVDYVAVSKFLALPGFHVFLGVDTTSVFVNKPEGRCRNVWMPYSTVT